MMHEHFQSVGGASTPNSGIRRPLMHESGNEHTHARQVRSKTRARALGCSLSPFQLCGSAGLLAGIATAMTLVVESELSPWVLGAIALTAIAVFLVLVMVTKLAAGEERIVYYHHEIAVIAGTALLLRLLRQPVLPYVDITVLGIGIFLSCGRIGCLLVGCCHGRPFRWGVRYGEKHARAGFTPYYVGIPLIPVQALESIWALGVVGVGASMVLHRAAPGSALAVYVIVYGFGRFGFEFLRGDPDRPYFLGFSEAQWISLILMSAIVYEESVHALPTVHWHAAILILLIAGMIGVAMHRRRRSTPTHLLFRPRHVREIAEALGFALAAPGATKAVPGETHQIHIGATSLGVQISASRIRDGESWIAHYALSCRNRNMTPDFAARVASLICLLKHANRKPKLVPGNENVYHFFVPMD